MRAPPPSGSGPVAAPVDQASTAASAPVSAPAPTPAPPSASTSAPTPAPVSAPTPAPGPVTTPRRGDSYHSQGPPLPLSSQQPQLHAYPRTYPQSRAPPAHYDADLPTAPPRHRPARIQAYERDRGREREREASPVCGGAYTNRAPVPSVPPAPSRARARSFSAPYRDDDQTVPPPVSPPRSRTQSYVEYRDQDRDLDDERPRARSEAPPLDDAYQDDGARYVEDSPSTGYSPLRNDEQPQPQLQSIQQQQLQQQQQQRWVASPSVSPSDHAVPHRNRRYHDGYRQQQQRQHQLNQQNQQHQHQQQHQMPQQRWPRRRERSSSLSRTASRSTSESRGYVRRGGPVNDARGGGGRR